MMDTVLGDVLAVMGLFMLFGFAIIGVYTVLKTMVNKRRAMSFKLPKKKDE